MPIHEVAYRHYDGPLRPPLRRFTVITRRGIALAFRNRLLRKILFLVYWPLLYVGPVFLAIGFATEPESGVLPGFFASAIEDFLGRATLQNLADDPARSRDAAWNVVFYWFLAYSQTIAAFLVLAFVGPPLIAREVRSRAFLLYFSKPITVGEYILGKAGVLFSYIALISLVPALLLYFVSIWFAPSIGTFLETWPTVLRIGAAYVWLAVPVSLLVLFFSSMVRHARYAAFAWIVVGVFGEVAFQSIRVTVRVWRDSDWLFLLSLRETIVTVQARIFDIDSHAQVLGDSRNLRYVTGDVRSDDQVLVAVVFLVVLSVACALGVRRRIRTILKA